MNYKGSEPDLPDMELSKNVGDRDKLARTVLTVLLAAVAISSFRKKKRVIGALAGVGAVALGYDATTQPAELKEAIGVETADEGGELRCSVCGDPIVPGQSRRPNANNEIVHEDCMESAE